MTGLSDVELLGQYVRDGSQAAFTELVSRHRDWVRSMALRRTRDEHLADDVTQAVFIVLAKKARSVGHQKVLSPWLFGVTRYVASHAMRSEARRKHHEAVASRFAQQMRLSEKRAMPGESNESITTELDQAVAKLRSADRNAVLFRFYEKKSLAEVGNAMAISEEAARKRVARAVEKLRSRLLRRGRTISAIALAAWLDQHAVSSAQAAAQTSAHSIASAAMTAAQTKLSAGSAAILAKGALHMMLLNKIKLIAVICILGSLPIAVPGVILIRRAQAANPAAAAAPAPAAAPRGPRADTGETRFAPTLQMTVADVEASVDFYTQLGFAPDWSGKPGPDGKRTEARIKTGLFRIMFEKGEITDADRAARKQFQLMLIPVEDRNPTALADLHDKLTALGVQAGEIKKDSSGVPQFTVEDPDGFVIAFQGL